MKNGTPSPVRCCEHDHRAVVERPGGCRRRRATVPVERRVDRAYRPGRTGPRRGARCASPPSPRPRTLVPGRRPAAPRTARPTTSTPDAAIAATTASRRRRAPGSRHSSRAWSARGRRAERRGPAPGRRPRRATTGVRRGRVGARRSRRHPGTGSARGLRWRPGAAGARARRRRGSRAGSRCPAGWLRSWADMTRLVASRRRTSGSSRARARQGSAVPPRGSRRRAAGSLAPGRPAGTSRRPRRSPTRRAAGPSARSPKSMSPADHVAVPDDHVEVVGVPVDHLVLELRPVAARPARRAGAATLGDLNQVRVAHRTHTVQQGRRRPRSGSRPAPGAAPGARSPRARSRRWRPRARASAAARALGLLGLAPERLGSQVRTRAGTLARRVLGRGRVRVERAGDEAGDVRRGGRPARWRRAASCSRRASGRCPRHGA